MSTGPVDVTVAVCTLARIPSFASMRMRILRPKPVAGPGHTAARTAGLSPESQRVEPTHNRRSYGRHGVSRAVTLRLLLARGLQTLIYSMWPLYWDAW